jgi:hypothetical protein
MNDEQRVKELADKAQALGNWFRSQGLEPSEGSFVAMSFVAAHLAFLACGGANLDEGIKITQKVIGERAHEMYAKMRKDIRH